MSATIASTAAVFRLYDTELLARVSGSGSETLAFLHGFDSSEGADLVANLAETYQVITFEHPGFGEAIRPDWAESVEDLAFIYLDWLDTREQAVHLVGSSFGGWIAAEVAVRNTRRLRSLTLIDAMGLYLDEAPPGDVFTMEAGDFDRARLYDTSTVPPDGFERPYRLRNMATLAMMGWNPRCYSPNLQHRLHRIDVPTLVVWGHEDQLYPPVYGETYQSLIPDAALEIVPEAGHLPYEDQSQKVAETLGRFLSEHSVREARAGGAS